MSFAFTISREGFDLLKEFEGFERRLSDGTAEAYFDNLGGVWTGPYGFTAGVKPGQVWTREEADDRLARELSNYVSAVVRNCTIAPNENQLAAMVCLAWNIGVRGFERSSVLKAHNRGDFDAAAQAFGLWNQAGGKVGRGLTRRRAAEAALYLKPVKAKPEPMPQQVDAESSLTQSPIVRGAAATAASSVIGVIAGQAAKVREVAESFGVSAYLPYLFVVAAVAGACYVIYWRHKQRSQGFA
jgi:lysozyme